MLKKATFKIVVLYNSEEVTSPEDWSPSSIAHLVTQGPCSGQLTLESDVELTREQMEEALIEQGSDPEFLLGEE
jgi:hypothetical protein